MNEKELLRNLGEETIYTAKGHFKACDTRRKLVSSAIWGCTLCNVLVIFDFNSITSKIIGAISLLGTIALLIWNQESNSNYRNDHKLIAEKYLALHKEIREYYMLGNFNERDVKLLSQRVRELDNSPKLEIPWHAKRLAKRAIEKKDEVDGWFKIS